MCKVCLIERVVGRIFDLDTHSKLWGTRWLNKCRD